MDENSLPHDPSQPQPQPVERSPDAPDAMG